MTVKVHYQMPDGEVVIMLFGDSYKAWQEQKKEWEWQEVNVGAKQFAIYKSSEPWIQIGGLKWCDYGHYQEELNLEAKRINKWQPNKHRKPRKLIDFIWDVKWN